MNLKTVSGPKDIPFRGIELVKTDKAITEVVIGGKLRIRKGESYSKGLELLVEAPFEEVERHRLTATIEGFATKVEYFESAYDAQSAEAKLQDKGAETIVEKVTVAIDDAGVVLNTPAEPTVAEAEADLIPF